MGSTSEISFGFAAMMPDQIGEFGAACEDLGAGLVTVGEGATEFRDPFLLLGQLAAATRRARLGIVVTTPRLRHPAVLANSFASLQELSDGRAVIGLGSGDLGLIQLGEPPVRLSELEAYATTVRALSRGDRVDVNGHPLQIRWATRDVPLWLAADGPKMLDLAGRVADGVVVGQAGHPDIVRTVLDRVGRAAISAGRSPDDVEVWFMLRALVTGEPGGAIALDGFDEYGARQAHFLWRVSGAPGPDEVVDVIERRKGLRLDPEVARRLVAYCSDYSVEQAFGTKRNVALLARHGLTDWAGELFYVSGERERVRQRVEELVAAGARNFLVPARNEATMDDRLAWIEPVARLLVEVRGEVFGEVR